MMQHFKSVDCAERGFRIKKSQLLDNARNFIIEENIKNPFTDNRPGKNWYNSFMKRHKNLSSRKAQNLNSKRASVDKAEIKKWFSVIDN